MARLRWDDPQSRFYSAGIDRGVLYVGGKAVSWNGLVSVDERAVGGNIEPIYLDGVRVRNLSSPSEYEATLTAFYSPPEFDQCDGTLESQYYGFYATNQVRKSFGLSYRTGFTNAADEDQRGYKIHMIYNAMVEPSNIEYTTISSNPEASTLSWDIKAVPNFDMTSYISAHYIFDTTKVEDHIVEAFEDILYGSAKSSPRLLTETDIQKVFVDYWDLTVTDTGQGYYTISGTDYSVRNDKFSYRISGPTVTEGSTSDHIESSQ